MKLNTLLAFVLTISLLAPIAAQQQQQQEPQKKDDVIRIEFTPAGSKLTLESLL